MLTDDFDLYYDFKFLEGIIFSDIVYTECSSFFTTIDELKAQNIMVYAAHLEGEKYYYEADFKQPSAILI